MFSIGQILSYGLLFVGSHVFVKLFLRNGRSLRMLMYGLLVTGTSLMVLLLGVRVLPFHVIVVSFLVAKLLFPSDSTDDPPGGSTWNPASPSPSLSGHRLPRDDRAVRTPDSPSRERA